MILHNPLHAALSSNTTTAGTADKVRHALTFTGGVSDTFDGSAAKSVAIPAASSTTPKIAASTAAVGSETKFARGDHVHPVQTSVSGNAGTATKLGTARQLGVNLARTAASTFDGTANQLEIPVKGVLTVANGGTGNATGKAPTAGAADTAAKLATPRNINGIAFDGSKDITVYDSTKVAKTGDTMTGDLTLSGASRAIKYASGTRTNAPISFYAGDVNGSGIVIGDGGRTIIGGGESAQSLRTALGTGTTKESAEEMHVASDGSIFLHTNCQTVDSRKTVTINGSGNVNAPGGFTGSLSGKATSADTADSAAKLTTARSLKTNLGSTTDVTFDGSSAQDSIPITGTLAVSHGGTGKTTASEALTALGGVPTSRKINTKALSADISLTASDVGAVPTTGGTVTGTLILSKTTDADGKSDKRPALIVGGQPTGQHIEIDGNEIMAKSNATTPSFLGLNNDGGRVIAGPDGFEGYLHGTADVAKKLDEPEYTDETDLNNLTTFGIYKFRNTVNNRPVNPGGTLIVLNTDSTYITQLAFSNSSAGTNSFHVRTHGANGWTAWQKVL